MQPRVLILTPNFRPETNAGARRVSAMSEALTADGMHVTVVTLLPHHPQNSIVPEYRGTAPLDRFEDTVRVIRLQPWIVAKDNLFLRLLAELYFCLRAIRYVFKLRPGVVIASSPYMFLGPLGLLAARLVRVPFIWDIRDLTWLYPRAAGKRTFGLDRLLERVMRFTAGRCDALTTVTPGLLHYFRKQPRLKKIIPNGVAADTLAAFHASNPAALDSPPPHQITYTGLFGFNHALSTVVDTALNMPDFEFLFVGDGPERQALQLQASGVENIRFLPYQNQAGLADIYSRTDILVSHVRRDEIHKWTEPAKLWEYAATGIPVVHAGEGHVVDVLGGNSLAAVVPPENPAALEEAIRSMAGNRQETLAMAARAREFVTLHRNRARLMQEYVRLVEKVLQPPEQL